MSLRTKLKHALVGVGLLSAASFSQAAGNALGTDVIRLVDEGQAMGDTLNVFFQKPLSSGSALTLGMAIDNNDAFMMEGTFKSYSGGYMNGIYYQAGLAFYNYPNNSDLGLSGSIGYEHSPATNFLFFGAVKGTLLMEADFIEYTPQLGVMFVF